MIRRKSSFASCAMPYCDVPRSIRGYCTKHKDGNDAAASPNFVSFAELKAKVEKASTVAMASGALFSLPATTSPLKSDRQLSFSLSMLDKSKAAMKPDATTESRLSPWLDGAESNLFVGDVSDDHSVYLNKFNIAPNHFILTTKEMRHQTELLTPLDIYALWKCLDAVTGLAFFNGGRLSGASQTHKHMQVIPFHSQMPKSHLDDLFRKALPKTPEFLFNEALDFKHLFLPLKGPEIDGREVHDNYVAALERLDIAINGNGTLSSYNIVMTTQYMFIAARSQAKYDDVSVNGLGYAGYLLSKRDWNDVKTHPMEILEKVSVPWSSPTPVSLAIVTDLDGTYVGMEHKNKERVVVERDDPDDQNMQRLNVLLDNAVDEGRLDLIFIYNSGRVYDQAGGVQTLRKERPSMRHPDWCVNANGVEIRNHDGEVYQPWAKTMKEDGWDYNLVREKVLNYQSHDWRTEIQTIGGSEVGQHEFRAAFYILIPKPGDFAEAPDKWKKNLTTVAEGARDYILEKLKEEGIFVDSSVSYNRYAESSPNLAWFFDIFPKVANKGRAAAYLVQRLMLNPKSIVVCGDSGNDLDMFQAVGALGGRGILVGNGEASLRQNCEKLVNEQDYMIYIEPDPTVKASAAIIKGLKHLGYL